MNIDIIGNLILISRDEKYNVNYQNTLFNFRITERTIQHTNMADGFFFIDETHADLRL